MTERLVLMGSGAHFAELAEIVRRAVAAGAPYEIAGRLTLDGTATDVPDIAVLGDFSRAERLGDCKFIADNQVDRAVLRSGLALATVIDPSSFVEPGARIGAGTVIYPHCFIGARAVIGLRCWVMAGSVINHDCELADDVIVTTGVSLAGSVKVGAAAYLGQSSTIRQYLSIGAKTMVGMGAVVTRDVPQQTTVVGNPARPLKRDA